MKYENLSILVVDDMSSMRMMIKSVLRKLGVINIHDANDGEKALEIIESHPLDLVICDWDMPKVDGFEVLEQVRSKSSTQELPFIMLTAVSKRGYVTSAIDAGVSDYLAKPFKPQDLIDKIQSVLA